MSDCWSPRRFNLPLIPITPHNRQNDYATGLGGLLGAGGGTGGDQNYES